MIRVTTNGILRGYKSNLMQASNNVNDAREKVLTQRNFNSYAEDPAAATQAFQLRRAFWRTGDQLTNSNSIINKFESAWVAEETIINDLTNAQGKVAALQGVTDSAGAGRRPLGEVLNQAAQSIVQNLNVKYGGSFIFAGSDTQNVPFTWDNGKLLFRGIDVSSTDPAEQQKLSDMVKETTYADVGIGMQEDAAGNLITSSAFNSALSGIDFLGYGVDKDGDPQNVASIMKGLSDIFSKCDADSGAFASAADKQTADRLSDKLNAAMGKLTQKHTELDGKTQFIKTNQKRLTDAAGTLNEEVLSIEKCDLADAITSFSWAQYCYNAALKVGNSILSESLMDYMR